MAFDKRTDEETDRCVLCGQKTEYSVSTPINEREGYVIGCGQLCKHCYMEIKDSEEV